MADFVDPFDDLPKFGATGPTGQTGSGGASGPGAVSGPVDPFDDLPQFNQPPPTTIQRFITNPARNIASGIVEGVTGRGRLTDPATKDLPEFQGEGGTAGEVAKTAAGLLLAVDPEARADVIRENIPGAEIVKDSAGNDIVQIRGENLGFVNKPGISEGDITQLMAGMLAFIPAARVGSFFTGLLGRSAATATAGGATSAGLDKAAQAFGSEQGVNLERAIIAGLFGAGAETIGAVIKAVRSVPGMFKADGTLTDTGRKVITDAGLDPDSISVQVSEALRAQARSGVSPLATGTPQAVARQARADAFDFPARRAQITGEFDDFSDEQQLLGGRGRRGEDVRRNEADQNVRIRSIADEFVDDAGRGRAVIEREADGGAQLSEVLQREARKSEEAANAAWEVFRSRQAEFSPESILDLTRGMLTELREVSGSILIDKSTAPHIHAMRTRLRSFEKILRSNIEDNVPGAARMKPFTIRSLDARRRSLSNAIDSAGPRTPEGRALVRIKRRMDDWIDEAIDKGLFEGDADVLDALEKARAATAEYKRAFVDVTLPEARRKSVATSRIMQKFIEDAPTDEQAVRWLFGSGQLGMAPESANVVRHLVATFGKDHETYDLMRQLAARRVLDKAFNPGEEIGGEALAKAVENSLDKNAVTIMRELFSPEEITRFREFAALLRDRVPARRTRGDTGSGQFVKQAMQKLAEQLGFSGALAAGEPAFAVGSIVGRRVIDWVFAKDALKQPRVLPRAPVGVAVASGAARSAAADEDADDRR